MTSAGFADSGSPDAGSLPTILSIDTTSDFGGLALRAGGRLIAERRIHAPEGFSQVLFAEIRQLLAQASAPALAQIDCFAAAAGPGSFTGVRVGLAAAKGLAEANHKPVAAVSNLRALASFGTRAWRLPLLDARRGEVYAAVYDQSLRCVSPEIVIGLPKWLDSLPAEFSGGASEVEQCGSASEFVTLAGAPFQAALGNTLWAALPWVEVPRGLAAAIALCAEADFLSGRTVDPGETDANYVRRSDAELFWTG